MTRYNIFLGIDTVGCVVAILISADNSDSQFDMFLHGFLSWFYVIYYFICK